MDGKEDINHYDRPVFGIEIPILIHELFQLPELQKIQKHFELPSLAFCINPFLQEKASQIRKYFKDSTHITSFLDNFQKLDIVTMDTFEKWNTFLLNNNIAGNWDQCLHQDKILSLFHDGKASHLPAIRWLSKIVNAFTIPGCLTDVVNLVEALNMKSITELMYNIIHHTNFFEWIPDIFIHDGEQDDFLCFILLTYLNPNLKVKMQLPIEKKFDVLEKNYLEFGWIILRDPDSKNAEALQHFHKI
jgi:hypothetical protein